MAVQTLSSQTATFRLARLLLCHSLLLTFLFTTSFPVRAETRQLPLLRVAHGAFNEKIAALWIGVEQGLFQKNGVNVEVVNVHNGPLSIQALASEEVQVAYTVPSSVLSAAAGGMDVAFFAGLVNKPDGDLVVTPQVRTAQDLKGKRLGIQSLGGGVWAMTVLALEHLGLEPNRDNISLATVGNQSIMTRAFTAGRIDGAYLSYGYRRVLNEAKYRILLDLGKTSISYQGLAFAARPSYLRQYPGVIDSLMRGVVASVAFIKSPANKPATLKSLQTNLRLRNSGEAEAAYEALQSLYSFNLEPNVLGIRNTSRALSAHNPKIGELKAEKLIDPAPTQRLKEDSVYRNLAGL